jgi:sigma-B regulation protein RsbU (phosphoserine phosphatase)
MESQYKTLQENKDIERRSSNEGLIFPLILANGETIREDRRTSHSRYHAYISDQQIFLQTPYYLVESTLSECPIQKLKAGDILITKEQDNHYLYLLTSGCLHIHFELTNKEVFVVKQGECVGEVSLFDGKPASAYVIAAEDCEVIAIHEDVFWQKVAILPNAAKNLLQLLGQRIRRSNEALLKGLEQQLKHEQLQKELTVAAEIQMNMLPKFHHLFPQHPQIKAYGIMRPAKEIGGDFYDAFVVDAEHIVIAIGDVSGKGIPAAMFMMETMTLLRSKMTKPKRFATALITVNKLLCNNNETNMFVTLFVGLLNVITGELRYLNGGHNPPLLARKDSPFHLLSVPKNILLGVYDEARYEVAHTKLEEGDMLVLYTDGVTEAENNQQEFFTLDRTIAVLNSCDADVKVFVNTLADKITEFCGVQPQSDDITIFALQYNPSSSLNLKNNFFEWTDDLSVEIHEIDEVLHELIEYTKVHFSLEEKLFYTFAYPDAKKHSEYHADLKNKLKDLQKKIKENKMIDSKKLLVFLKHWLQHHIAVEDKQSFLYLNSRL